MIVKSFGQVIGDSEVTYGSSVPVLPEKIEPPPAFVSKTSRTAYRTATPSPDNTINDAFPPMPITATELDNTMGPGCYLGCNSEILEKQRSFRVSCSDIVHSGDNR